MIVNSLVQNAKVLKANSAASAGTSAVNGDWIDTLGFAGVTFLVPVGTVTSTGTNAFKLQYSSDGSTSAGDIAGSLQDFGATDISNTMVILEVYRPKFRYVRFVDTRGTANTVLNQGTAILFNALNAPVTQTSFVSSTAQPLNSPNTGTA